MTISDWLDRRKSERHDRLKKQIEVLREERNLLVIQKHPAQEILRLDRKIIRLEKRLRRKL